MEAEWVQLKARLAGVRYLLVAVAPFRRDARGQVWLDPLWHRDLLAHLDYLSDLTVLAPRVPMPAAGPESEPGGLLPVEAPGLRFVEWPGPASMWAAPAALPRMIATALRAVRGADVVHGGAAGWPVPPGLLANPLAVLLRRPLVVVVESAFWRLAGPGPHGRAARLRARATEALARWSARRAALSVYTQPAYLDEIGGGARGERLLTPASLLDEGDVLGEVEARAAWAAKEPSPRFVLAARLESGKGVGVLLDALRLAEARGLGVDVTVIGEGALGAEVRALAGTLRVARLAHLDPVPYGPAFLSLLEGFHAVLVPSLTDEQPRILLDAFARAVPAIASDTAGHRDLVAGGAEPAGWLLPPGDPEALLAAMTGTEAEALAARGLAARRAAAGRTRGAMHLARARALARLVGRPSS